MPDTSATPTITVRPAVREDFTDRARDPQEFLAGSKRLVSLVSDHHNFGIIARQDGKPVGWLVYSKDTDPEDMHSFSVVDYAIAPGADSANIFDPMATYATNEFLAWRARAESPDAAVALGFTTVSDLTINKIGSEEGALFRKIMGELRTGYAKDAARPEHRNLL